MLQVGHGNAVSYDYPSLTNRQNRKRKRRESSNVEDSMPGDAEGVKNEPTRLPSSCIQVKLQNGTILEANAIVCTLPLGILKVEPGKPGHVRFVPPLPDIKQKAIQQLGCGLLNKCAMSFSTVFWQDSDFLGLADISHSYLVLNAMAYTGKPILVFMYGGAFAADLESWTDAEIVDDCLSVLKKICGKEVPAPIDYCVTRWGQEQFSKMAFTHIPPGVDGPLQLAAMSEAVYDPVQPGKPLIMFAGEHTTPYHPSTIHGAFLSGIREAYRLDLYVEPALNNNMVFEATDKLYQHTFAIRRIYKSKRKGTANMEPNSSSMTSSAITTAQPQRQRRRGVGMTLRKQPRTLIEAPFLAAAKKQTPLSPSAAVRSRRSQRSVSTKKLEEAESPTQDSKNTSDQERRLAMNDLEDRILLRSLESYGRDVSFLRTHVLPVFGSNRRRSADQIRSRWKQLKPRSKSSEAWKSWVAATVAQTSEENLTEEKPVAKANETADGTKNLRRSQRETKPRHLIDV